MTVFERKDIIHGLGNLKAILELWLRYVDESEYSVYTVICMCIAIYVFPKELIGYGLR